MSLSDEADFPTPVCSTSAIVRCVGEHCHGEEFTPFY